MLIQSIKAPAAGATQHVSVQPNHSVQLDFSTADTSFTRLDNDLVVQFTDGSNLTIDAFFVTDQNESLPSFILEDGVEVASADFLQSMNPDMDITTAAGPASASANGSGAGEYADGAGNLIDGVDALGSLGTTHWDSGAGLQSTDYLAPMGMGTAVAQTGPDIPTNPIDPIIPTDPHAPDYQSRAVLYIDDLTQTASLQFRPLLDGKALLPEDAPFGYEEYAFNVEIVGEDKGYFVLPAVLDDDTGIFTLTLTQAGLDALAAGNGANLYAYFNVTFDGQSHVMQVVVNQDGSFTSATEDIRSNNGDPLSEGYEWHTVQDGAGDSTIAVAKDATVETWYQDTVTGSLSAEGTGRNIVTIKGSDKAMEGGSISLDAGDDSVTISGQLHANSSQGSNTILTGEGKNIVDIRGSLLAENGGANHISGGIVGENHSKLTITNEVNRRSENPDADAFAVHAQTGGTNTIENFGNATFIEAISDHAAYGLRADGGDNTLSISRAKITAKGEESAYAISAVNGGANTITIDAPADKDPNLYDQLAIETKTNSSDENYALYANDGTNTILGNRLDEGGNTINVQGGGIIYATGSTGLNSIQFKASAGENKLGTYHITAEGGGKNQVTAEEGSKTTITAAIVSAKGAGENSFTIDQGNISLSGLMADNGKNTMTTGDHDNAVGITKTHALAGGTNSVQLGEGNNRFDSFGYDTNIKASGSGSLNEFIAGSGNDVFKITNNDRNLGPNRPVLAEDFGINKFTMGDGDNTFTIASSNQYGGLNATTNGQNIVTGGKGNDTLTIKKVEALSGGKNIINMGTPQDDDNPHLAGERGTGENTLTIKEQNLSGISAKDGGQNIILGDDGKDTIIALSIRAEENGLNSFAMGNGDNILTAEKSGIWAQFSSKNIYKGGENKDTILIEDLNSSHYSSNTFTLGDGENSYTSTGRLAAIGNSTNTITGGSGNDKVNIGTYIYALGNSTNFINLKGGTNTVTLKGPMVTYNDGGLSTNTIRADVDSKSTFTLDFTSTQHVQYFSPYGAALNSQNGTNEIINFDTVNITVQANSAEKWRGVYGLDASSDSKNTIHSGKAITVTINVDAGTSSEHAYSLYAGGGGKNEITGGSTHDTQDIITLTGDIMASGNQGQNLITTGAGNDIITINGNIQAVYGNEETYTKIDTGDGEDSIHITGNIGGKPLTGTGTDDVYLRIDTGSGNDTLRLDGAVEGLELNMGEGDYDTLILSADTIKDFTDKYENWLNAGGLDGASVEAIHIDWKGSTEDYNTLLSQLKSYPGIKDQNIHFSHSFYTEGTETTPSTETLHLGDLNHIFLDDMLVHGSSDKLMIDLTGDKENSLTLGEGLFGNGNNALQITSDGMDSINLGQGNWFMEDIAGDANATYTLEGSTNIVYVSVDNHTLDQSQLETFFSSIANG